MRVWQILVCVAFVQIVSVYAFSFPFSHESYKSEDHHHGDLEVAASGHGHGHSSGFEESGGSDHGEDHESKVIKIIFKGNS
jgi:hypothetical protein